MCVCVGMSARVYSIITTKSVPLGRVIVHQCAAPLIEVTVHNKISNVEYQFVKQHSINDDEIQYKKFCGGDFVLETFALIYKIQNAPTKNDKKEFYLWASSEILSSKYHDDLQ